MKTLFALTAIAVLSAAPAFAADVVVPLPHFDSIELQGHGHVVLKPGTEQHVVMHRGGLEFTHFQVDGNHKLLISACNAACPWSYHLQIEITSPDIPATATGGGTIDHQ
ncbi:MAG TPA: hypothetical protein VG387_17240 [Rhizomicrobium sp.]|nr:hypothetical protein [Rhizomicrobium sp.]